MPRVLFFLVTALLSSPAVAQTATPAAGDTTERRIGEVTVRTKYKIYQEDSIRQMQIYHKVLGDVARKPEVGFGVGPMSGGVTVTGGITKLARVISGRHKREKRFVEELMADQESRFISLRYTPALVETLTGLSGDSLSLFMAHNPMPHEFARTASDLELKMWIRTQARAWVARRKPEEPQGTDDTPVIARP